MRYPIAIIEHAKSLRANGASFANIGLKLKQRVPKATLAYWCRGILLSPDQLEIRKRAQLIHLIAARKLSAEKKRKVAVDILSRITEEARTVVKKFRSHEAYLLALAMLYLGEGAKSQSHSGLQLGSSDPQIIRLYIRLLWQCFSIPVDHLRCRISYRADQNIDTLQHYWTTVTGIPLQHFYKTTPDKRTVGKETKRKRYQGVCVISCRGRRHQLELQEISVVFLESLVGQ